MKAERYGIIKIAENIVGIKSEIKIGDITTEVTTIVHMPFKKACKQMRYIIAKNEIGKPEYGFSPRREKAIKSEKITITYPDKKTEREVIVTYYPMNIKGIYLVEEYDINSHQREYNIEECSQYGNRCHLCC